MKKRSQATQFDWQQLNRRMAMLSQQQNEPDDATLEQLFAERAVALSKPLINESNQATQQVLIFELGNEQYGLPLTVVSEVMPKPVIARIPSVPAFVLGVIGRRGEIISVMSLSLLLGLIAHESPEHLIVIEHKLMSVAFAVDQIIGIQAIADSEVQPLPTQSSTTGQYLAGVTAGGIIIIELTQLLSDEKLIVDQR